MKLLPVVTVAELANAAGVTDNYIRDDILHFNYNNDSCIFFPLVDEKFKSLFPEYNEIILDVRW